MRDSDVSESQNPLLLDLRRLNDADLSDPLAARRVWDTLHVASSLQGIVNREGARLFVLFMEPDAFWWEQFHEPGQWLAERPFSQTECLHDAIRHFAGDVAGVVTYRERPYSASNVASSVAGVERRLCVREGDGADSLAAELREHHPGLFADAVELVGADGVPVWERAEERARYEATGSVKNNAYRWLLARYPGAFSAEHLGYYIDSFWLTDPGKQPVQNCTLTNHDYFISRGAIVIDLNAWEDESPVDEPDARAGLDLETLRLILRRLHDRRGGGMLHVGGFTPWAWKYSDHPGAGSRHHGVQSEWELIRILSAYDAYLDADAISLAGMVNASFYQHFPLEECYPQASRAIEADADEPLADKAYVMFYMGDYDAAAWLNQELRRLFEDPARGSLDLCWAFNPNLDQRAPHAMHYARVWATERDHFVAGDSGAGYVSPGMLAAPRLDPDLPDGYEAWIEHCRVYYERYDLDITGFIIEGRGPAIGSRGLDAYARISPGGTIAHRLLPETGLHASGMPYGRMTADIDGDPEDVAEAIMKHVEPSGHQFLTFRSVLKSPTWVSRVIDALKRRDVDGRLEFVGPNRLMANIRRYERMTPPDSGIRIDRDRVRDMLDTSQPTR
ncbi:GxGYxYP domain-containing protein [Mucisphaera calidilacus]|uniref:GxGYxYP putative glycoside hydrolase C-terminal domain-containing protein n=1 Tax=Mucisphaera calidilacus TaxID=2527982 RepID=A0A518BWS1_9BACT|nr:GxGYxYP domain-containing protein [Mucisphaera calidilacus]QDU71430.1 hypothetical protein Pan265_12800 [Mucisphaera calidilacus]